MKQDRQVAEFFTFKILFIFNPHHRMLRYFAFCLFLSTFFSCRESGEVADAVFYNGNIYTLDSLQPQAEAVAVKNGKILKAGATEEILKYASESTKKIDLKGKFMMPGFIEGHGHFSGLGKSLMQLNFLKSKSWEEIVAQVEKAAAAAKPGEWIEGRGWHQEKWDSTPVVNVQGYPHHHALSDRSPYNPIVLRHASGHSLFANAAAMQLAGISAETPDPKGGKIIRDGKGNAIGVFEERAMDLILGAYESYLKTLTKEQLTERWLKGVELAQQECLKKGITSFQDAGVSPGSDFFSSSEEIQMFKKLAETGKLQIRLWAMLRENSGTLESTLENFPIINAGDGYFTCRAIKSEIDGALGSYGAWLLEPYNDKPGFSGQNTTDLEEIKKIAELAIKHKMQLCVHAIGDRGNREVLNLFEEVFKKYEVQNDHRWRIEHAQHLNPDDIKRMKSLNIIASMQGIHCTSDAPFVVKRLGEKRAREGAYNWRALLDAGCLIANGTDAPVEDVDPIPNLYASVTRRRADTGLEFFPDQSMNRREAIQSYTLSNAFAAFEEKQKGNISPGKWADFVVLSQNIFDCSAEELLKTKVLMTIVGGNVKFEK